MSSRVDTHVPCVLNFVHPKMHSKFTKLDIIKMMTFSITSYIVNIWFRKYNLFTKKQQYTHLLRIDNCLDDLIRSKMFKNTSGVWQCTDCNHTSPHTTNIKNHIEVKHVGSSGYYCQECNKFCSTKNALNNHRTRYRH